METPITDDFVKDMTVLADDQPAFQKLTDFVREKESELNELRRINQNLCDQLADAHARISSDLIARQFLVDENNKWRECANKLAALNLKTVPLFCLELDERAALSTLENLNVANRDGGTASANGGWLRRLVKCKHQ